MELVVVLICAAFPLDADTVVAIPFVATMVLEGPRAMIDAPLDPEVIDAEFEVLS
jgi:hypothetical protein